MAEPNVKQELKKLNTQVDDLYKKHGRHEKATGTMEGILLDHVTKIHKRLRANEEAVAKLLQFLKSKKG